MASQRRPHKPQPPPKRKGKIDYPDLFEWAKKIPAVLDVLLGDVTIASERGVLTIFVLVATAWLTSSEDSTLRPILGVATLVLLFFAAIVWAVRARRSRMLPSVVVGWYSFALIGAVLVFGVVLIAGLYQDRVRSGVRQEAATKLRQDDEAAQAAAAEVKRQTQLAQDAAARAAAAQDEAARQAEQAAAQIAEAKCLQARDDASQKAAKAQANARKAIEDCKAQYAEQLIPFKSLREICKPAYARLASAQAQIAEAKTKVCGADSEPKNVSP